MASPVDLSGSVRFDLRSGTVRLGDDAKGVVVPASVLAALVKRGAGRRARAGRVAISARTSDAASRKRAGGERTLLEASLEHVATLLAAELAVAGLGTCNLERWGRALVVHVADSPIATPQTSSRTSSKARSARRPRAHSRRHLPLGRTAACAFSSRASAASFAYEDGSSKARAGATHSCASKREDRIPMNQPRIGKLEALLARIQANAARPRVAHVEELAAPPVPEEETQVDTKPREIEVPLESRARLVAAPRTEVEPEEIEAEEVLELDDRHIVNEEPAKPIDAFAATTEMNISNLSAPSARRTRSAAAVFTSPDRRARGDAARSADRRQAHTPPPESGKQVAADALSFDDDLTGVREAQPPRPAVAPEPSIQLQSLRSPATAPPATPDEMEVDSRYDDRSDGTATGAAARASRAASRVGARADRRRSVATHAARRSGASRRDGRNGQAVVAEDVR